MTDPIIAKTIYLNAPKQLVWSFLVDKDKLATWFHPADQNLAQGQPYALLAPDDQGEMARLCWGEVLEMDAPNRLVYSFTVKNLAGAMTKVEWNLEDALDGTKLTLTHSGIQEAAGEAAMGLLLALDAGWDEHFSSLRTAIK